MRTASAFGRLRRASEGALGLALLAATACQGEPPAVLPPPAPVAAVDARAVRKGSVHGFLARPAPDRATGARVLLRGGAELDDASRSAARAEAERGAIALLVPADVDPKDALSYLGGLPGEGEIGTSCLPAAPCTPGGL